MNHNYDDFSFETDSLNAFTIEQKLNDRLDLGSTIDSSSFTYLKEGINQGIWVRGSRATVTCNAYVQKKDNIYIVTVCNAKIEKTEHYV